MEYALLYQSIHPEAFMTELTVFQRKLSAFLPDMDLRFCEPMSKHTSFRIGGGAEVMAFPKNRE